MNKVTVELSEGQKVVMHCPTVKAVKNAYKSSEDEMEISIVLVANACNMTPEEVEALSFPDYLTLSEKLTAFLGKGAKPTHPALR
jgi:transaldolase